MSSCCRRCGAVAFAAAAACRRCPPSTPAHPRCSAEFFRLTTLGKLAEDDADAVDGLAFEPSAADADTIAAIVTGAQQGAVSIIRLSGDDAVPIAQRVFRPAGQPAKQQQAAGQTAAAGAADWEPESHRVYYGRAVDAAGAMLDEVRCREGLLWQCSRCLEREAVLQDAGTAAG